MSDSKRVVERMEATIKNATIVNDDKLERLKALEQFVEAVILIKTQDKLIADLKAKTEYLDIPLFLRNPEGFAADLKAEFDKLNGEIDELQGVVDRLSEHSAIVGMALRGDIDSDDANSSWISLPDDLQDKIEVAEIEHAAEHATGKENGI